MAYRAERFGTRGDTAAFIACLVLSLTALALPEGLRAPTASFLRRTVLLPAVEIQTRTERSAEYRASMDALRAQRDSLALDAAGLPELVAENARLRGLIGLGHRLVNGFVAAEVLHQVGVTDGFTLLLSAGRGDGVEQLAPVVAPEGLVGLVRSVDPATSVAMAWTHPDFRAGAMIEDSKVYGIVAARRGERSGDLMELRGVAYRDQLQPGARVVTSGLGGVFPRGIPIGTVQGILSESAGWERTYLVRPAVHPAEAAHVMILSPARARDDLGPLFAPDSAARDDAAMPSTPPPPQTPRNP